MEYPFRRKLCKDTIQNQKPDLCLLNSAFVPVNKKQRCSVVVPVTHSHLSVYDFYVWLFSSKINGTPEYMRGSQIFFPWIQYLVDYCVTITRRCFYLFIYLFIKSVMSMIFRLFCFCLIDSSLGSNSRSIMFFHLKTIFQSFHFSYH